MIILFCLSNSFLGQGEFGEVFQGTAIDILGPDTGPHPVAIKVYMYIVQMLHLMAERENKVLLKDNKFQQ